MARTSSTRLPPLSYLGLRSQKRIGRALRSARRDAALTQAELAAAAGVSREAVSVLENGQRGTRVATLIGYAASARATARDAGYRRR